MSNLMAKLYGGHQPCKPQGKQAVIAQAKEHQFAPREVLALEPKAFGMFFDIECPAEPEMSDDGVVVIDVRGPLMHHRSFWCDSYDAIRSRVAAAIALNPRFIVLNIDSPGGLVSGAFDTARSIRQMVTDAEVELYSHITGVGASAAYALATSASWIGVSETAMVGSVGVVDALIDATEQNAMFGINVKLVASGQRKTDGNPDEPMTEGAINATQVRVDELAEMFFALVTEHGFGQGIITLRALQAGVFTGKQAVELGLASEVITFEETLAFAKPGAQTMPSNEATKKGPGYKMSKVSDAIESLREAAEGDDEEAEKARKMLQALDDDEPDAQDDEEDETPESQDEEEDEPDAKAQDEEEDEPDAKAQDDEEEDDEKDAKALALKALAEVHNMKANAKRKEKQAKRNKERAELIASRNDFSDEIVALLEDKSTSLATVRKMVKTLERGKPRKRTAADAAAAARANGTRGAATGDDRSSRLDPEQKAELDSVFGLNQPKSAIKHEPHAMIFGAPVTARKEGN